MIRHLNARYVQLVVLHVLPLHNVIVANNQLLNFKAQQPVYVQIRNTTMKLLNNV